MRRNWTRDELILAINLYCKTPFGKIHNRNPDIIKLADVLGRTPSAVGLKLANFASIDPSLDRKGMSGKSKLDEAVWKEFSDDWEKMAYQSEMKAMEMRINKVLSIAEQDIPEGKVKETIVETRVNQKFFREMILASYDSKCCITGLPIAKLLIASHIIPWSSSSKERLNPQNGLCLNALHDKAFDRGLISIDEKYRVMLSKEIKSLDTKYTNLIGKYENKEITMPQKFVPDQDFLEYHRQKVFID